MTTIPSTTVKISILYAAACTNKFVWCNISVALLHRNSVFIHDLLMMLWDIIYTYCLLHTIKFPSTSSWQKGIARTAKHVCFLHMCSHSVYCIFFEIVYITHWLDKKPFSKLHNIAHVAYF